MKKIPRIIGVERIEDKPDLWKVMLYTGITIFLSTEVLFRTLLKQQEVSLRTIRPFIRNLVQRKNMEEEQVIIKLIQVFTTLPPPGNRYLWININYNCIVLRNYLSKEDSEIYTELRLDTTPENILVRFVYLGGSDIDTSWMNIEIKDLINVIWQQ